jgi:hypothetical protein
MLQLLKSEEDADVSFNIKGKTFLAHSIIIKAVAPILASCCTRITSSVGNIESSAGKTIDISI